MTTPDAARAIDRDRLAQVVATCVSVPAWSGMSEPRRMACRQAVDFILADLAAQGFVVVRREDLWRIRQTVGNFTYSTAMKAAFARIDAALTGQAGEIT